MSSPAEARVLPSGEKATVQTLSVWPVNFPNGLTPGDPWLPIRYPASNANATAITAADFQ